MNFPSCLLGTSSETPVVLDRTGVPYVLLLPRLTFASLSWDIRRVARVRCGECAFLSRSGAPSPGEESPPPPKLDAVLHVRLPDRLFRTNPRPPAGQPLSSHLRPVCSAHTESRHPGISRCTGLQCGRAFSINGRCTMNVCGGRAALRDRRGTCDPTRTNAPSTAGQPPSQ